MSNIQFNAFTYAYSTVARQLLTDATIKCNDKDFPTKRALWDTGATMTCISMDVVKALGLVSSGRRNIHTPSGSKTVCSYMVDIILPNNVRIPDVMVCDSDIGDQGLDMLIGMNIISTGDFAVTQVGGKTTFSFCIPPKKKIDYVAIIKTEQAIGPTHGKGKRKKK